MITKEAVKVADFVTLEYTDNRNKVDFEVAEGSGKAYSVRFIDPAVFGMASAELKEGTNPFVAADPDSKTRTAFWILEETSSMQVRGAPLPVGPIVIPPR
jgi:hypothetical protein